MARGGGDFTGDSPSSDPALRGPIGSAICGVLGTRARNCWSSVDETGDGENYFTGVGVCVAVDCVMGEARQSLDGGSASSIETGDRGAAGLAAAAGPAGGLVAGAGPAGGTTDGHLRKHDKLSNMSAQNTDDWKTKPVSCKLTKSRPRREHASAGPRTNADTKQNTFRASELLELLDRVRFRRGARVEDEDT